MKTLTMVADEIQIIRIPLEAIVPGQITTFKDLKVIDRILSLLDDAMMHTKENGLETKTVEVVLEEADYEYLRKHFEQFSNWNPGNGNLRKLVIGIAEQLGVT